MPAGAVRTSFGKAVKEQRYELGISQEELADRSGLHRTYISDVERGARNISLESIEKLARALELTVAMLFEKTGRVGAADRTMEILLVEDDPRDAELALRAFRKARIANVVHLARDGQEALDFLFGAGSFERRKNQPLPGVILLDLNLPKVDGLEVLRTIKSEKHLQGIPVIVLTVSVRDRDIDECRRMGVECYLVKPVSFQSLSELTPRFSLDWELKKPVGVSSDGGGGSDGGSY